MKPAAFSSAHAITSLEFAVASLELLASNPGFNLHDPGGLSVRLQAAAGKLGGLIARIEVSGGSSSTAAEATDNTAAAVAAKPTAAVEAVFQARIRSQWTTW
jgi:hypothetical protein